MATESSSYRNDLKSTLVERLDTLYEYKREQVSEKTLHGWKTFLAMFPVLLYGKAHCVWLPVLFADSSITWFFYV
ncbi:MAG: hypothetical protein JW973_09285 [Bacteroidales bacterium]|nr:hypothetical protein [Bacteroidales bacterium]